MNVRIVGLVDRGGGRLAVLALGEGFKLVEFTLKDVDSHTLVESSRGQQVEVSANRAAYWQELGTVHEQSNTRAALLRAVRA